MLLLVVAASRFSGMMNEAMSVPAGTALCMADLHDLSQQDIDDVRSATKHLKLSTVCEITDPKQAEILRISTIEPIIRNLVNDPNKSTFQNEDVTKLISASECNPFSNFTMHLKPGGQDGRHVHPYGPRNLIVFSDKPWFLLCGAVPAAGHTADIKKMVKVQIPAGQFVATFPANMPHGFDSIGNTVAHSIHGYDLEEIRRASIGDSKDIMRQLTRDLGADGMVIIGGKPISYKSVLELNA